MKLQDDENDRQLSACEHGATVVIPPSNVEPKLSQNSKVEKRSMMRPLMRGRNVAEQSKFSWVIYLKQLFFVDQPGWFLTFPKTLSAAISGWKATTSVLIGMLITET